MSKNTGTHEWAQKTVNIQIGCEHGCIYCYARYQAVNRFHYCTAEQWLKPVINQKKVDMPYLQKVVGGIMFPSTHDITLENLSESLCVLRKLFDAGNQVLIVSKPHLECVKAMCETFLKYKNQLLFRFTIGSTNNDVLKFWEPNAPDVWERLECLQYAYKSGFRTSVSCEPYLDVWPLHVYLSCVQYVTDDIWFGILRNFNTRVNLSKINNDQYDKYVQPLLKIQTTNFILSLVNQLRYHSHVMWKDSIQKIIDAQPVCSICKKEISIYEKVDHCRKCHSGYNKKNYALHKE